MPILPTIGIAKLALLAANSATAKTDLIILESVFIPLSLIFLIESATIQDIKHELTATL